MTQHVYETEVEAAINKLLVTLDQGQNVGAYPFKLWVPFGTEDDVPEPLEDTESGITPWGEEVDYLVFESDALEVPDGTGESEAYGLIVDQVIPYEVFGMLDGKGNFSGGATNMELFENYFGPFDVFEVAVKKSGEEDFTVRGAVYRGVDYQYVYPGEASSVEAQYKSSFHLSSILAVLEPGDQVKFRIKFEKSNNPWDIDPIDLETGGAPAGDETAYLRLGFAINMIVVAPSETTITVPTGEGEEAQGFFINA